VRNALICRQQRTANRIQSEFAVDFFLRVKNVRSGASFWLRSAVENSMKNTGNADCEMNDLYGDSASE
jgi:hypothetical protein